MLNFYSIVRSRVSYTILLLIVSLVAQAQSTFRSVQSGSWTSPGTWEENIASVWSPTSNVPDASNDVVTVQESHVVNIPAGTYTIGQTYIEKYGKLIINSGATVTVANVASAVDLGIFNDGIDNATFELAGTLILSNGAVVAEDDGSLSGDFTTPFTTTVKSTGSYFHKWTTATGNILGAIWEDGSNCTIDSYTSASGNVLNLSGQSFYNFTYNCPGQAGNISFAGALTSVRGNLLVENTGLSTVSLRFATTESNVNLTVGGSFTTNNASRIVLGSTGINNVYEVTGNFAYNSTGQSSITTTGSTTLNIGGDFSVSAGTLNFGSTTGNSTMNLPAGNFIMTGGSITRTSATTGSTTINFNGTTKQAFTKSAGTIGTAGINFVISANSIVDFGISQMTGSKLTVNSGATIALGSLNSSLGGVIAGNIGTTSRTFIPPFTIEFNGAGEQYFGNLFPANVNVTINKPSGAANLTASYPLASVRILALTNGNLNVGNFTLTVSGNVIVGAGAFSTNSTSVISFDGSGTLPSLPFAASPAQIGNLTLNRSGAAPTLGTDLSIYGVLDLTAGTLDVSGRTITFEGTCVSTAGSITGNSSTNVIINGVGAFGFLPLTGNINTFTVNRTSSGTVTVGSIGINSTFNLTSGAVTATSVTMGNGSTVNRSNGTISPELTTGGSFNISYLAAVTTGNEFPTSATAVNNVSIAPPTGIVSLGGSRTINGTLTLTSGALAIGNNTLTLNGLISSASGSLTGGSTSNLIISGTAANITLPAISGGISQFTLNRSNGVTLGANLTISTVFNLTTGALTIGANTLDFTGLNLGLGTLVGGSASNLIVNTGVSINLPTITGGLNDLTIQRGGSNTATLANTLTVTGDIYLKSGVLATGGLLNLDLNSGSIAYTDTDAGSMTGNLRVFKSLPRSKSYVYMGSPLKNSSMSDFTNANVLISPVYKWDDGSRTAVQPKEGWIASGTSLTNDGTGYAAYAKTTGTVDVTGAYSHGETVNVTLKYNNISAINADNGYNLVANPFPSALNWSSVPLPAGVDGDISFYVGNGAYTSYSYGGFPATNLDIPPFQAVMVRTAINGAVLSLPSSARNTNNRALLRTSDEFIYALGLTVKSGNFSDKTYLRLRDDATEGYDTYFDARKFKNDATAKVPSLFTQAADVDFAVNSIQKPTEEKIIPLQFEPAFTGAYSYTAEELGSFFGEYQIYLEDKLTGTYQDLLSNPVYNFSVNSLAAGKDRFNIIFQANPIITSTPEAAKSTVAIKGSNQEVVIDFLNTTKQKAQVSIVDVLGKELKSFENIDGSGRQILQVAPEQNGVYIVKVIIGESVYSEKVYLNR